MFAHKAVQIIRQHYLPMTVEPEARQYLDSLAFGIDLSEKIDFGDAEPWHNPTLWDTALSFNEAGVFVLPFPTTWAEVAISGPDGEIRYGALFTQEPYAPEVRGSIMVRIPKPGANHRSWFVPYVDMLLSNGVLRPVYVCDEAAEVADGAPIFHSYFVLIGALAAFSASGTRRLKNDPPEKLNARRRRRGQPPLYSYWTLGVDISGREGLPRGALGHDRKPQRLHWVRGHLRRHKGEPESVPPSIPVQAHLRGLASAGVVAKDYRVRRRPEEVFIPA